MDLRTRQAVPRQYEDFDPEISWLSEEGAETLRVHLPGFKKEQLRVQLTPNRLLKISGQRLLGGNKWQRFMKEVQIPLGCDVKEITAKFEGGVLYVRLPKLITRAELQDKLGQTAEVPKPQSAPTQPMPAPAPAIEPAVATEPAPAPAIEPAVATELAPAPVPAPAAAEEEDAKEEKTEERRAESEADTRNKNKEESRDKAEIERNAVVAERRSSKGGVLKELKKPENVKMLAVIVVAAIALAIHLVYVNKVCRRNTTEEL